MGSLCFTTSCALPGDMAPPPPPSLLSSERHKKDTARASQPGSGRVCSFADTCHCLTPAPRTHILVLSMRSLEHLLEEGLHAMSPHACGALWETASQQSCGMLEAGGVKLHGDEGRSPRLHSLCPHPGSWREPEERTGIGSRSSPASWALVHGGAQQPLSE